MSLASQVEMDGRLARDRASIALASLAATPDAMGDPLVVVAMEALAPGKRDAGSRALLEYLASRRLGYGRTNRRRYRWSLGFQSGVGSSAYQLEAGSPSVCWRSAERDGRVVGDRDTAFGDRLMEPITIATQFRYWGRLAMSSSEPDIRSGAVALLDEATPTAENDIARWLGAEDPWRDTFGLWLLSAEPEVVERLRDVVFALAVRYGGLASRQGGVVRGMRFPFHDMPLVSASAHLASGLWCCGVYPSVVPSLIDFVASSPHDTGGWADGDQEPDVLTTLAAADLLARLDPGFDPSATIDWFARHQEPGGWWRALNPEVPWLTSAIAGWMDFADQPFSDRFTWPSAPIWARDRLTGLTTMAILDELEAVLGGVPALAALPIEAAFLDLAGFGDFNSQHGQVAGDEVLAILGASLRELENLLAVRIGGDEFLLFGKPGASPGTVASTLESWRDRWAATMTETYPGQIVAPRIMWSTAPTGQLHSLRRDLGNAIGPFKVENPRPSARGDMRRVA